MQVDDDLKLIETFSSDEAERSLLCVMLVYATRATRAQIRTRVPPAAFFMQQHVDIAAACYAVDAANPGDAGDAFPLLVKQQLLKLGLWESIGGTDYFIELSKVTFSGVGWERYVDVVSERWRRRWLHQQGRQLADEVTKADADPIASARRHAAKLGAFVAKAADSAKGTTSASAELADQIAMAEAGKLSGVAWPWPALTDKAQALRPGSITVIAGGAGDSKSLLVLQAFISWIERGYAASMWALEEGRAFHTARALAQIAHNSAITSFDWMKSNPGSAPAQLHEHSELIDRVGAAIKTGETRPTLAEVADWVEARAAAGDRIIVVDPVTRAKTSDKRFQDDEECVARVAYAVDHHRCSMIAVTHPPKLQGAKGPPGQADIAGGAAWSRFTQAILFLKRVEPPRSTRVVDTMSSIAVNATIDREVHILKARSGPGQGKRIGFKFDQQSLMFEEAGIIVGKPKPAKENEEGSGENSEIDNLFPPRGNP